MIMDEGLGTGLTAIFEAANISLREFYLGTASPPISLDEFARRLRESPPPPVAHWKASHEINHRCLDAGRPEQECPAYLRDYAKALESLGWKVVGAR
jgi:nucleoside-diphosphate-sugar epimerase